MPKPTWIAALATTVILTVTTPVFAAVKVQLNGQPLTFDVPPVVENGRTLVPVRTIFEALGARITWDPASQTVSAVHPERDKYVVLTLGSTTAWVDGRQVTLDVAPKSVDGRTMVPLRFISTAMGAEVTYDDATETVSIKQAPVLQPEEPAVPDEAPAPPETAAPDESTAPAEQTPTNAQLLSRFTRSVALTHLKETQGCSVGTQYFFDDLGQAFAANDSAFVEERLPDVKDKISCWDAYENRKLPTLPAPAGTETARAALQQWVDLNQSALAQLELTVVAHQKGETAERDRLLQHGQQLLSASTEQEKTMRAAMNAVTSDEPQFLTVDEHVYVASLDGIMSLSDNCFSQLLMTESFPGEEASYAKDAATCMLGLPSLLKEEKVPTPRMQALLDGALSEIAAHTQGFAPLAARLQAGPMDPETLHAEIEKIMADWDDARPAFDRLFVYRDYGRFGLADDQE